MRRSVIQIAFATITAIAVPFAATAGESPPTVAGSGIVKVRSAYAFAETVTRLEADIAAKSIKLFLTLDQSRLAAEAGIPLRPSTLLLFGNPPLGTQFITSKPDAGLDWPVRMLVSQTASGEVEVSYTDFGWIGRRHGITDRDAQLAMASEVAASIAASIAGSVAAERRAASSR